MIDYLELQVPLTVPRRKAFWHSYRPKPIASGVYEAAIDARKEWGLLIHCGHRVPMAKAKQHVKVQFDDVRFLTAHDLVSRLGLAFDVKPEVMLKFKVARVDFAADVHGIPVQWFRESCHVRRKRKSSAYIGSKEESSGGSTTLVFGKRPDLYRIYNKIAEKRQRGVDILYTGMYVGEAVPTVTRIERQCTGRSVSSSVSTLGKLLDNATEFDPFDTLVCSSESATTVATDDWKPQQWLMNIGLASAVQQFGEAAVRSRLNRDGNAPRYFNRYSDLLRSSNRGPTREYLRDVYRASTWKQLNLPSAGTDGKPDYPQGGLTWML